MIQLAVAGLYCNKIEFGRSGLIYVVMMKMVIGFCCYCKLRIGARVLSHFNFFYLALALSLSLSLSLSLFVTIGSPVSQL